MTSQPAQRTATKATAAKKPAARRPVAKPVDPTAAAAAAKASASAAAQNDASASAAPDASPAATVQPDTPAALPDVIAKPSDPTVAARRDASRPAAETPARPKADAVPSLADLERMAEQLPPEDRDRLLSALGGVKPVAAFTLQPAERGSAEWVRQRDVLVALLMDGDHARGCPGARPTEPGADVRIEFYPDTVPPKSGAPARAVTVVACLHCGNRRAVDDTHTNVTQRVIDQLAAA